MLEFGRFILAVTSWRIESMFLKNAWRIVLIIVALSVVLGGCDDNRAPFEMVSKSEMPKELRFYVSLTDIVHTDGEEFGLVANLENGDDFTSSELAMKFGLIKGHDVSVVTSSGEKMVLKFRGWRPFQPAEPVSSDLINVIPIEWRFDATQRVKIEQFTIARQ